jgi:tetratricopeptide (TPR) repeat protein
MGDYAKTEPFLQRALKIREKALGPDHPNTAASLNNLAALYRSMGDYAKAKPLHERALKIREKALGPDHPDTAQSLINLAELYHSMGDYAKAEPLYEREKSRKALGPEHPEPQRASTIWRVYGWATTPKRSHFARAQNLSKSARAEHPTPQ